MSWAEVVALVLIGLLVLAVMAYAWLRLARVKPSEVGRPSDLLGIPVVVSPIVPDDQMYIVSSDDVGGKRVIVSAASMQGLRSLSEEADRGE